MVVICKMNKNGFTLLELLAVIVILAILSLVTIPNIINTLKSSKDNTFEDSMYALYKSCTSYYEESNINSNISLPLMVKYKDKKATYYTIDSLNCKEFKSTSENELEYSGQNFENAILVIRKDDEEGKLIEIKAWNESDKSCYKIDSENKKVTKTEKISLDECTDTSKICSLN